MMNTVSRSFAPVLALVVSLAALGCSDGATGAKGTATPEKADAPAKTAEKKADAKSDEAPKGAEVGKPAPDFTLKDLDGKDVSLASFKGKTVVLEWFNPGCPFVKNSYGKGSLKGTAKRHTEKGVVWLSINSGAPGKQGAGLDANKEGAKTLDVPNPILLDEEGKIGKAYGATNTPHLFIVDKTGTLVYAGAIDNSPDGEGESPEGGKLVNYVDQAVGELDAGKPVSVSRTKAYGCGVKYGS
jgi:alkyl hydroperoxide reductase subunit AhpC